MFPADGKCKDVLKAYKKLFNKINLRNVQELGIRTKDKLIVQTSFLFLISTKTPFKETFNFDRINCCCCFRRNLRIFDFFISSFIITRLFSNFFPLFIVHCSFLSSHSHIFVHVAGAPSIVSLVCEGLQRIWSLPWIHFFGCFY